MATVPVDLVLAGAADCCRGLAMKIGVLGPLQLLGDDGAPVVLHSWHRRLLLAVLIAARSHAVRLDELAEALWPDELPRNPGAALQSQVSRLRRQLGRAGGWVETAPAGYRFVGPVDRLDCARFERLLARARDASDEPAVALDLLDDALCWATPRMSMAG